MDAFISKVNSEIINPIILFLFALAIVYFLYGMLEFLLNQQNDEAKTTGKSHMIWGIVGIAIMLGVWTIMNIVINTFNIQGVEILDGQEGAEINVELN